ncbi:hypothetical protein PENNAL_c0001G07072 [Penicillium nalgiovense]|uniref:Uncharacterized protein n=1 Tax=Penicillium nalgiovense TaxID=60175 RepID=A0A1V6ZAD6_PENNA|nr:hypothetical protein PENNAL_c0001G07072 [Penicillium nalgiovense]
MGDVSNGLPCALRKGVPSSFEEIGVLGDSKRLCHRVWEDLLPHSKECHLILVEIYQHLRATEEHYKGHEERIGASSTYTDLHICEFLFGYLEQSMCDFIQFNALSA